MKPLHQAGICGCYVTVHVRQSLTFRFCLRLFSNLDLPVWVFAQGKVVRKSTEEVRAKIQQAIRPHEDLLATKKRRKLQWYGHVSRSSGLAKTILQATVEGGGEGAVEDKGQTEEEVGRQR